MQSVPYVDDDDEDIAEYKREMMLGRQFDLDDSISDQDEDVGEDVEDLAGSDDEDSQGGEPELQVEEVERYDNTFSLYLSTRVIVCMYRDWGLCLLHVFTAMVALLNKITTQDKAWQLGQAAYCIFLQSE